MFHDLTEILRASMHGDMMGIKSVKKLLIALFLNSTGVSWS